MKLINYTLIKRSAQLVCMCVMLMIFSFVRAQTVLSENFNYAPGTLLTSANWVAIAGTGTNNVAVSSGNLAYVGSLGNGMGNKVSITNNGQDVYRSFTATNAPIYSSLIVNVSAANATGDFFYSIGTTTAPATTVGAKLFIRANGTGFSFGVLRGTGGTPVYETTVRPFNTNILVVLKYEVVTGTTNDGVKLYVNPGPAAEPAVATVEYTAAVGTDASSFSAVALMQGTAVNAPTLEVDGIHVGSTWNSVMAAGYDYGDTPVSYDNTKDGVYVPARHSLLAGLSLGSIVPDLELSPLSVAAGADNNGTNGDGSDEDAIDVSANQIRAGVPYVLTVPVTNPTTATKYLYGWIDFNNDGKFQAEEVATTTFTVTGATNRTLTWTAAQTATIVSGVTKLYMRLRLSDRALVDFTTVASGGALIDERSVGNGAASATNASDFSTASNGEVEDYQIEVVNTFDYGDVPTSFENDKDGNPLPALHAPLTGFSLGSLLDVESAPASVVSPNENNTAGDNADGTADEDGLTAFASVDRETSYSITVPVSIPSTLAGTKYLYGWLDLNGDGRFQVGEVATATTTATSNTNITLTWTAAQTATIVNGTLKIYLRLRLSNLSLVDFTTSASGGALIDERSVGNSATTATNSANSPVVAFGEIEDYQIPVISTIRYNDVIQGGVTMIGNSWYRANAGSTTAIVPDVDDDPTTTWSTSADLILPPGSTIEKVLLSAEKSGAANFTSVMLKVPGSTSYTTLTAATSIANRTNGYAQMIWDITSMIPANGYVSTAGGGAGGRYFVAQPTPAPAYIYMGGWSMIVVYKNANSKYRHVLVTDSWQISPPTTITKVVSGVKIPASGTVKGVIGITGTYGDRPGADYLRFGKVGTTLTNLKDPMTGSTTDVMNSSIAWAVNNNVSADGGPAISGNYTARNPISQWNWGDGPAESYDFDADIFDITGILAPSSTPVDVVFEQYGSGDVVVSGSYFISIDVATPPVLTKNLSVNSIPDGGITSYIWTVTNNAADAVFQSIDFTDNLPSSIKVAAVPNASITGGTGGVVTADPNTGHVTVSGLLLNPGESATITVDITNVSGELNVSCTTNPSAFTNGSSNITIPQGGILNTTTIVPQCLIVTDGTAYCYKPGLTGGTLLDSKVGITSLSRAGIADPDNWPMVRKGAWMVLESKTKGFVVNRVAFNASNEPVGIPPSNFVEGMLVYDITNNCLKMYTSTDGGATFSWQCLNTQACPD
ncbi:GEVED domain-containing protein [Chryseobacterium oryctis]|uniref:GEVED domain-containing protein n=1 Tax=Chryseobacterium oryctis TaxID=2952618 RepID=A0ABT3HM92_9FLAO|nr:GEVED domain-containing protein [Chryseobacterium oryctis]MCW3160838.1 GEVED domain-containing protein [Chryseobacterium oryctis]